MNGKILTRTLGFIVGTFALLAVATSRLAAQSAAPLSSVTYRLGVIDPNVRSLPYEPAFVKPGTRLQLTAGNGFTPVTWYKNNVEVVLNSRIHTIDGSLFIENFLPQDQGSYSATNYLPLTVRSGVSDQMTNVSVRGEVEGGKNVLIAGFYVSGTVSRTYLVRGIGPSLASFGIGNPLSRPRIAIYDKDGNVYENSFLYVPVVGGLTPEAHVASVSAKVGAFTLNANSGDFVEVRPMSPGSYTVVLTAASGDKGTALIEIYDGGPL